MTFAKRCTLLQYMQKRQLSKLALQYVVRKTRYINREHTKSFRRKKLLNLTISLYL